jgi:hypothetical protein
MVDGDIGRILRSEAGKNPTVKMLGSLAQVFIFNPFHTVTVLLQVASASLAHDLVLSFIPHTYQVPSAMPISVDTLY